MIYGSDEPKLTDPVDPSHDAILGPAEASVTLVEYGDYECPHCGAAHQTVKELFVKLSGRLRYVFRHFPLTQLHPHALLAAESAEAAGAQGKFWEMHDTLLTNQEALDFDSILIYAENLCLDLERFFREVTGHVFTQKLRSDYRGGMRSGVNGTPTFFLNGVRLNGSQDLYSFMNAIDAAA